MSLDILQVEKKLLNHNLRLETYFLFGALIRALSKKGKLSKAKKIVSKISYFIKLNKQISVFLYIHQAISYIRPLIGLKTQASLKYNQKPQVVPITLHKSYQYAIRWLIQGALQRSERTMSLRLFNELNDAYNKKGFALKKKYEWHSRLLSAQLKSYSFKKNSHASDSGARTTRSSSSLGKKN
jgi:small subunit ribosomal protein S7